MYEEEMDAGRLLSRQNVQWIIYCSALFPIYRHALAVESFIIRVMG
jgi:hypothetical protein